MSRRRSPRATWWLQLLPLCLALAHASTARAADAARIEKRLRVVPGATCLNAAQLAAEVERVLDDAPMAGDFVFFVYGSASDPHSAYLRVVRQEGTVAQRAFEPGPARCNHLHAAVALAIALAIQADQDKEHLAVRPWSVSATGLWSYRLLPQFAPGVEVAARRAFGEHALVRAGAAGVFAFDASLGPPLGTIDATLVAGHVAGCGRLPLGSAVHAGACFGVLGGMLHVSGNEAADSRSSAVPWFALSGGLDVEFALSDRWSLGLGLTATLLLHRVQVGFENPSGMPGPARDLDRAAFSLGFGVAYYL